MTCDEQEEQKILTICKEQLSAKVFQKIFVLTYDRMRRYEGNWHLERQLLFPEHVFFECENESLILEEIGKNSDISQWKNKFIRVNSEKEELLKRMCGEEHHLKMSKGIIHKGNTKIIKGPLKGMENRICGIDRHKRLARVKIVSKSEYVESYVEQNKTKMEMNDCYISVGLEITEKVV